jgi:lysophospholipase L1-like esterase
VAQDPPVDWTMPGSLGSDQNGDGLTDYAGSATAFSAEEEQREGFEVDMFVRHDLCKRDALYTWRSTAGTVTGRGGSGCEVSQRFPAEDDYPVQLEVRFPGGRVERFDRTVTVQDWLVVSIGDSVASGEGNPDRAGKQLPGKSRRALWESPRCHRSATAAPAQAAIALEKDNPHTAVTFVHLACSGATIETGLLGGYEGIDPGRGEPDLLPQLAELQQITEKRRVDAVLLSIGANDINFGKIVSKCLIEPSCMDSRLGTQLLSQAVEGALGELPGAYEELARGLSEIVPAKEVIPVEYFDPTGADNGDYCQRFGLRWPLGISYDEAEWAAKEVLEPLNEKLAVASANAGWTEVTGVSAAFKTHGYCADDSWIVDIVKSFKSQKGASFFSRFKGGFHPNEKGHEAEATLILPELESVLSGSSAQSAEDTTIVTVEKRESEPDEEGDTERLGGIALGLAGAALAAGTWAASRRRGTDEDGSPWWLGPVEEWAPTLDRPRGERPDPESVAAYGALVENQADWVHRRVESVEIVDERIVRRRTSVDFTPAALPGISDPKFAPIALLSKQVLTRFDLRDETGQSLPLASSGQNASYAAEHMLRLAEEETGEAPSPRLGELCWQVARGEPEEAWRAVEEIAFDLEPESARDALRGSERFRAAASTFASSFAVMVEVDRADRRRVVKFAYDQVVLPRLTRRQRLGLDPVSIGIELPEVGDAASRHLEFVRSEGLEYWSDGLFILSPDGNVLHRPTGRVTGDAHLDVAGMPRGTPAFARVLLRAVRSRILRAGPPLAFLSAAALTCAWFALPGLADQSAAGAASILIALPAVFGAFLGSRQTHPLEGAMLAGARALVFLAGALSFAAAAALAFTSSVDVLRVALGITALLSWACFAGLVVTARTPRSPDEKDRDLRPYNFFDA